MLRQTILAVLSLLSLTNCSSQEQSEKVFAKGYSLGKNKNEKLEEASGLVASQRNKGFLWTHNDGGKAELFLLDTNAVTIKVFTLAAKNRDWEDIALGAGPEHGVPYLYVGDIGDNFARYPVKYIYRVKEPSLNDDENITRIDTLRIVLSDEKRDSETLLSDPISGNLYLVSKRDFPVGLYEITNPSPQKLLVAQRIADLPLRFIVGGDISPDGSEVLLKSYDEIYYWKRNGSESLADLLTREPILLPYVREPQGEAIAWALNGSGFYTLGENARGTRSKLYYYKRISN